jgi:glycerol-3-phosphate acyltransferase PlsY
MIGLTDWSVTLPTMLVALGFGYLTGSVPFGLLLTRLAGTKDLRSVGSGNIGATNVLRTGHKGLAAATLVGDALKGTLAVLAIRQWSGEDPALLAGLGAFLGHLFPIWLRFRGGKGVATYIGILLAFTWHAALAFGAVWLAAAALTRYSSLAGLLASIAALVAIWLLGSRHESELIATLTALMWLMHRGNIVRLVNGTESKIGQNSQGSLEA